MGDYDIFYTYLADEGWDKPKNVKPPVNTIDDDRYYVLSADAKTGYYSTSGRSELGTHDIFSVSPGHFGERPVLALVVGVIQAGKDVKSADISVTNSENGEKEGDYKSNAATGKYMLALTPGNKYKIAIEVEGYETKIDYIDIESLESYVEVEHDFNVLQDEIVGISDELNPLQSKIDNQILQYKKENTADGYDELIYAKIINESGGPQNLRIRIVVGAAYGSDVDQVVELLLKVGREHQEVCNLPDPRVRLRGFGASSLDFNLMCWINKPEDRGRIAHELYMAIYKSFNEHGVEIPYAKQDVYIKQWPAEKE